MTDSTLVERMEKFSLPRAWLAEIKRMQTTIDEQSEKLEEYLATIDTLARQMEATDAE